MWRLQRKTSHVVLGHWLSLTYVHVHCMCILLTSVFTHDSLLPHPFPISPTTASTQARSQCGSQADVRGTLLRWEHVYHHRCRRSFWCCPIRYLPGSWRSGHPASHDDLQSHEPHQRDGGECYRLCEGTYIHVYMRIDTSPHRLRKAKTWHIQF